MTLDRRMLLTALTATGAAAPLSAVYAAASPSGGFGMDVTKFGVRPNSVDDQSRALQEAIWSYAREHDGNAPSSPLVREMNPDEWLFPGGGLYCLMPDVKPGVGRQILVYEPSAGGSRRFVLLADGSIEDRAEGTLKRQIEEQMKP